MKVVLGLVIALLLVGCGKDSPVVPSGGTTSHLTSFSFSNTSNPGLAMDVQATISGTAIRATVPFGTDVTALVASFATTGVSVEVGGVAQTSGTTRNNFTTPVTYTVTAADGTTSDYAVTVTVDTSSATCGQTLGPSSSQPSSRFGYSVAISGDGQTLVVGAIDDSSNATGVNGDETNTSAPHAGAAYVFVRSGSSWVRQAYLKASNTDSGDLLGYAVAISGDGNTIAIGAGGESSDGSGQADNSVPASGAIYVFTRTGSIWTQQAYLKAADITQAAGFGEAVALSGDGSILAGGSPTWGSGVPAGTVTMFARSGTTWTTQERLLPQDVVAGDFFGNSLALSRTGDILAVGGYGKTHIYVHNGAWGDPVATLQVSSESIAMSAAGDEIVCGSPFGGAGAAYVLTGSGTTWTQQAMLVASVGVSGDYFGWSVALSGDGTLASVGTPDDTGGATCAGGTVNSEPTTNNGAAYRFTRAAGWSQTAYDKAPAAVMGQQFGDAVSLSDDGATLVVGAPGTSTVSIIQ